MALSAWDKTRVYGTWYSHDGERLAGTYRVTMPVRVTVEAGEAIVPAGIYAQGDLNIANPTSPALDVMVPANDDPDVTPAGWQIAVEVTLTLPNAQKVTERYVIDTPVDGEVNLRTIPLVQAIPPRQTMLLRGVAGGVAGLDGDGDVIDADGNKVTGGEGGGGGPVAWGDVQGKPTTFPPDLTDVTPATIGAQPAGSYATAAQGTKADSAVQPAGIADFITAADVPDAPTWGTITGKPAVVAEGTSQTAARAAIGAGTSNLQLGTGSTTAKAGDYTPSVGDVPNLPASKITSGTLDAARIPALPYATTAQGALADSAVQPGEAVATSTTGLTIDSGTTLPTPGNPGRIFIVVPE